MKKIISIAAASAIALSVLCACGKEDLTGTWDIKGYDGMQIIFYEDGTFATKYYTSMEEQGTYKQISSDELELVSDSGTIKYNYALDETNNAITLEQDEQ